MPVIIANVCFIAGAVADSDFGGRMAGHVEKAMPIADCFWWQAGFAQLMFL